MSFKEIEDRQRSISDEGVLSKKERRTGKVQENSLSRKIIAFKKTLGTACQDRNVIDGYRASDIKHRKKTGR